MERESSLNAMIPQSGRDDSSSMMRCGMSVGVGLTRGSIKRQSSLRRSVIWLVSSWRDAYIIAPRRKGKAAPYRVSCSTPIYTGLMSSQGVV